MSKLLINEQPLQVLPSLAARIGLHEAIFLQQLHYWLQKSKHEHDERRWIYNTLTEWQAQFPFWSERTLQRIVASLVAQGLVVVHKFNTTNWDRTNWYSIEYEAVIKLDDDREQIQALFGENRQTVTTKRRLRRRQSVVISNGNLAHSLKDRE